MQASDFFPLFLSLRVATVATLITLVLGLAAALALARSRLPGRAVLEAVAMLPLVLPPTVLGYYLLVLLGRGGALGEFLEGTFGVRLVFTWQGAVVAAVVAAFPLMVQSARTSLESVDRNVENAARTLGRSELSILLTVTLPLAWRGVFAGAVLAFARSLGEFGITLMIAGNIPGRTQTMSIAIYDAVQAGNTGLANMLVAVMTAVVIALLVVVRIATREIRW